MSEESGELPSRRLLKKPAAKTPITTSCSRDCLRTTRCCGDQLGQRVFQQPAGPDLGQRVDAATRHRMQRVRQKGTAPELALRRALSGAGIRGYRLNWTKVPDRPDLAWVGRRVAVFVDGAFWHGHPPRYWQGRSGPYWDAKIARNQARDRRNDVELVGAGWRMVRIWGFEVKQDVAQCVERIRVALGDD